MKLFTFLTGEKIHHLSQLRPDEVVRVRYGRRGRFDLAKVNYVAQVEGNPELLYLFIHNKVSVDGVHSASTLSQETPESQITWGRASATIRRPGTYARLRHKNTQFSYEN